MTRLINLFFLFFISISLFSQKENSDSILLKNTKYRLVGPFRGGRSCAVIGDAKNKNTFYMGSTGGGVWKTIDGGSNWKNISDKYFGGSIGCISISKSDPTIIYVGEGENSLRGNVSEGFGMWRSVFQLHQRSDEVYEGMVIGENSRSEDMDVNCVREKKLTNMRASGTDESERLIPAKKLNMEGALEFCREDECVEVTPAVVRIRKVILDGSTRARITSKAKRANENS